MIVQSVQFVQKSIFCTTFNARIKHIFQPLYRVFGAVVSLLHRFVAGSSDLRLALLHQFTPVLEIPVERPPRGLRPFRYLFERCREVLVKNQDRRFNDTLLGVFQEFLILVEYIWYVSIL